MSLELTALIVVMIAGILVPIPILMLHIIEAIIQAYIFGVLALVLRQEEITEEIQIIMLSAEAVIGKDLN